MVLPHFTSLQMMLNGSPFISGQQFGKGNGTVRQKKIHGTVRLALGFKDQHCDSAIVGRVLTDWTSKHHGVSNGKCFNV